MKNLFTSFLLTFLFICNNIYAQNFWEQTNGPFGGDVRALVVNSSDNIFAGTRGGGVHFSSNNGDEWIPKNNGLTANDIMALAINSSGDIFAATTNGIFLSINNGDSWIAVNNGLLSMHIVSLAINSNNHIFAGTFFGGGGIFRSTDNGQNWVQVNNGLGDKDYVQCLAVNSSDHIFAGAASFKGSDIFRSTDNGNSWGNVSGNLTNPFAVSLAINSSDHVFAGMDLLGGVAGVARTTDDGVSWTILSNGFNASQNVNALAINSSDHVFVGTYGNGIFRSTNNGDLWTQSLSSSFTISLACNSANTVFGGNFLGGGAIRSVDNGDSWVEINNGLISSDVRALMFTSNFLFAGTYGIGIFRSSDNGESWEKINSGLTALYVTALIENQNGDLFAATDHVNGNGGLFRSTNNGDTWFSVTNGLPDADIRALAVNSLGHIFAGTYIFGVYRSTNNGDSWTEINNGLSCNLIWSLSVNPDDEIFAGTAGCNAGVFRSINNGDSWTQINNGFTSDFVKALNINTNGDILAATQTQFGTGGGIFRSTNNGDNWTDQSAGLTVLDLNTLSVNSLNHIFTGTVDGVFSSTDNGESWFGVSDGLTNSAVYATVINASDGFIYVGTGGAGVFRSVNTTIPVELISFTASIINNTIQLIWKTASEINNLGFEIERSDDKTQFHTIGFVEGNGTTTEFKSYNFIDAFASAGKNYYRLKQIDFNGTFEYSSVVEVNIASNEFALLQNYPNPFNPSTTISFQLAVGSHVSLKIYNVLGQDVITLINKNLEAGVHNTEFNAEGLNSGIYFYTLEVNGIDPGNGTSEINFSSTKKMVILK